MNGQRDLEGLSALVTGATSGIGRAAAEELGRHGAEVIVHGRDAGRGQEVVDAIAAQDGKARFVAADLGHQPELEDLVQQVGAVDILVNNAGFSWFGPTEELDVATFDRLFAANVRAPYFLVAALAPNSSSLRWHPRWQLGEAAASSTSGAWPARSASQGAPPTAPPRPHWRR
jgi:NAD(P)-dependent dehydrogenase (short-subunit alcohol dehydrogenase family)